MIEVSNQGSTALKRSIGLWLLVFYGLGNILGAGIYVLVGKVAGSAGLLAPLAFLLSALVAAFSAFSYSELVARYPVSAGEAVYVQQGFGWRPLSMLVGLCIALAGMVSAAAIAKGFVGYLHVFIELPDAVAIVLLLLVLGGLAGWGINQSVMVAGLITLIEIAGLVLVIAVGSDALLSLPERLPEFAAPFDQGAVWGGLLFAAFLAFYAFLGFEDMVNVAEEVKEPSKTFPRAIVLALIISSVLYMTVALVSVLVVPPAELSASQAPMALVFTSATGQDPGLIGVIGMFAVINGALIQIIMVARLCYGMSRQGWLPSILGRVSSCTQTPLLATVFAVIGVMVLALWVPLTALAGFTSFLLLLVFALVNLALLRIKHADTVQPDVRIYPWWVPAMGFVLSIGLVLVSLVMTS